MSYTTGITASFKVTSGALCFGTLHDVTRGADAPIQRSPHTTPQAGGTVKVHPMEYNVAAKNGVWNAYALVTLNTVHVVAWFVVHESVRDPLEELHRILRVAGCPYEHECGSTMNDDKTMAN